MGNQLGPHTTWRLLLTFTDSKRAQAREMSSTDFYVRYYVGHKGKFGHEFLEFEFRPDGKMRYANNSNYKNDTMIRKEAYVNRCVLSELKRIIEDSEILKEDDNLWPRPDRVGRQERSRLGRRSHFFHNFQNCSLIDVNQCKDPRVSEPSTTWSR